MLNNVALIYRRSGRQKAAEPYYKHALELYEKQLGPEHPDVAAVLNNLGVFYTNEGRLEEAELMHQRALAIRRKAGPKGSADIAQSNCNLAVVYHSRGDLARAEELYRESLRNWEGMEKPPEDYQIVASNYADLLRSLGKKRKAAAIESRARKRRASIAAACRAQERDSGGDLCECSLTSARTEAASRHGIAPCHRRDGGQLTGRSTRRSRGGMADAYGSGPYGETRGGSTPLVSRRRGPALSLHGIFDYSHEYIGREVFETLDHALTLEDMVMLEGNSCVGKTTAAQERCAAHQGEARLVSLSGISHKAGFFQKLATAIGLAASNRKATDMQVKVEEFFRRTGLMLIIDEAHYLWPQHQRSHSSPELVDWVNTALVKNHLLCQLS